LLGQHRGERARRQFDQLAAGISSMPAVGKIPLGPIDRPAAR
jgi:hypothetical protein